MLPSGRRYTSLFAKRCLQHVCQLTRPAATLACELIGSPGGTAADSRPLRGILLHGLLGSGRNWRSFARRLAMSIEAASSRPVQLLLLDLRNHGASARQHGIHPPHTMETAAQDIVHYMQLALAGQTPQLLVGHSLGGKVLLELLVQLQRAGSQLPQQAWVLDSQPGKVSMVSDQPTGVAHVINTISSIPLPVPSREWLYQHLQHRGFSAAIAQWLGSNLVPDPESGKLVWAFDIQGAAAMYNSYRASDYLPLLARPPCQVHLVRGELSDRWDAAMLQQLQECERASKVGSESADSKAAPGSCELRLHVLPKAGHWLHTDNPDGLHELVHRHVLAIAQRGPRP